MQASDNVWLHRFALFVALCTFFLVIAGALVTSNDAGLSVPDWPTSLGGFHPPMVGGIFYEHSHRMIASFVGLLTIVLAVWLGRREQRRWVRRLGWAALATVVAQGLLGGATVLLRLPATISIAHACLAQSFFCLTVALAVVTSPGWRRPVRRVEPAADIAALHRLALVTPASIFFQLALGAALRHSDMSIVPHLAMAMLVTVLVLWTTIRVFRFYGSISELLRPAAFLLSALVVQLFLGFGAYWVRVAKVSEIQPTPVSVTITTAHVALGAALFAGAVVLALQTYRRVMRPGAVALRWNSQSAVT